MANCSHIQADGVEMNQSPYEEAMEHLDKILTLVVFYGKYPERRYQEVDDAIVFFAEHRKRIKRHEQ